MFPSQAVDALFREQGDATSWRATFRATRLTHQQVDDERSHREPVTRDHDSDAVLLARLVRAGDPRAFDALYRRHTDMLYATAVRMTSDPDVAADVVHDAWVRVVERGGGFERRSTFRTWVTGIVVNIIRERARDGPNAAHAPPDDHTIGDAGVMPAPDDGAAPLGMEVAGIDPIDLDAAIAALPEGFRQVLVLHDVEGFTHEEIAAMLGIVPGTSKSQLARARHRVRHFLTNGVPRRTDDRRQHQRS